MYKNDFKFEFPVEKNKIKSKVKIFEQHNIKIFETYDENKKIISKYVLDKLTPIFKINYDENGLIESVKKRNEYKEIYQNGNLIYINKDNYINYFDNTEIRKQEINEENNRKTIYYKNNKIIHLQNYIKNKYSNVTSMDCYFDNEENIKNVEIKNDYEKHVFDFSDNNEIKLYQNNKIKSTFFKDGKLKEYFKYKNITNGGDQKVSEYFKLNENGEVIFYKSLKKLSLMFDSEILDRIKNFTEEDNQISNFIKNENIKRMENHEKYIVDLKTDLKEDKKLCKETNTKNPELIKDLSIIKKYLTDINYTLDEELYNIKNKFLFNPLLKIKKEFNGLASISYSDGLNNEEIIEESYSKIIQNLEDFLEKTFNKTTHKNEENDELVIFKMIGIYDFFNKKSEDTKNKFLERIEYIKEVFKYYILTDDFKNDFKNNIIISKEKKVIINLQDIFTLFSRRIFVKDSLNIRSFYHTYNEKISYFNIPEELTAKELFETSYVSPYNHLFSFNDLIPLDITEKSNMKKVSIELNKSANYINSDYKFKDILKIISNLENIKNINNDRTLNSSLIEEELLKIANENIVISNPDKEKELEKSQKIEKLHAEVEKTLNKISSINNQKKELEKKEKELKKEIEYLKKEIS